MYDLDQKCLDRLNTLCLVGNQSNVNAICSSTKRPHMTFGHLRYGPTFVKDRLSHMVRTLS